MSQQQAPKVETQNQAVGLLIQATQVAHKRGAFNLEEAALLSQAVNLLTPDPEPADDSLEELAADSSEESE